MHRRLKLITFALLTLGIFGWISGGLVSMFSDHISIPLTGEQYEWPLGALEGIAVDSSGNLYCDVHFYNRVQKYDPQGKFVRAYPLDTSGGTFRIRVNEKDELEVATARTDRLYRFSSGGELLELREDVHQFFDQFGPENEWECTGPDDTHYEIRLPFLFPRVVKSLPSGEEKTVVSVPIHKWLIMGPFPAFAFCVAGMLSLMTLHNAKEWDKKRQRVAQQNSESAGGQLD